MAQAQSNKNIEKLTDEMKASQLSESDMTTELDTVINKVVDPALVAKWPKLQMKVPLFIHQPVDFKDHAQKLLKMNMKFYQPYLGRYHTEIEFPSFADHKAMAQYCDKNKLPYHTFGHPSKRKIKVIIKGMPNDTNLNTVKEELKKVSVPVVRVHKMKNKEEKVRPLLLLAVVPHDDEGKRIFAIKKILGSEVTLEPPKNKVKQCHRCQLWGHSQRYCHGTVKCVKCAGEHWSKKCTRDRKQEPPKCANCAREHTANFRDCAACPESQEHKDGWAYSQRTKPEHIGPPIPKLVTVKNVERNLYRNKIYIPNEEEMATFTAYVNEAMEKDRMAAVLSDFAVAYADECDVRDVEDLDEMFGYGCYDNIELDDKYESEMFGMATFEAMEKDRMAAVLSDFAVAYADECDVRDVEELDEMFGYECYDNIELDDKYESEMFGMATFEAMEKDRMAAVLSDFAVAYADECDVRDVEELDEMFGYECYDNIELDDKYESEMFGMATFTAYVNEAMEKDRMAAVLSDFAVAYADECDVRDVEDLDEMFGYDNMEPDEYDIYKSEMFGYEM